MDHSENWTGNVCREWLLGWVVRVDGLEIIEVTRFGSCSHRTSCRFVVGTVDDRASPNIDRSEANHLQLMFWLLHNLSFLGFGMILSCKVMPQIVFFCVLLHIGCFVTSETRSIFTPSRVQLARYTTSFTAVFYSWTKGTSAKSRRKVFEAIRAGKWGRHLSIPRVSSRVWAASECR